ncbi:MAG: hypothetical protein HC771_16180 [Synechococcales cyanobacterium CRU_2_2]|nr:hypothetical protein [Synechococcales cyanobacterium CRU_2_2]
MLNIGKGRRFEEVLVVGDLANLVDRIFELLAQALAAGLDFWAGEGAVWIALLGFEVAQLCGEGFVLAMEIGMALFELGEVRAITIEAFAEATGAALF